MAGIIFMLKTPTSVILTLANGNVFLKAITTILIISIAGFVYLYSMMLIGGIKKNDIDSISPRIFNYLPRFLRKNFKSKEWDLTINI